MIHEKIGIKAIDQHLEKDDIDEEGKAKLGVISETLEKAIIDISKKLDIPISEIKERINKKLINVQYMINANKENIDSAFVDLKNSRMVFGDIFFLNTTNKTEIAVHELTHLLGREKIKSNFYKTRCISGYETVDKFFWMHKKENQGFNEAATQMFASYNNKYNNDNFLGYNIYTNQSLAQSIYKININLLHQMIIAKGLTDKELFDGLFNYDDAVKFMSKYDKTTFTELSQLIDVIYHNMRKISQSLTGMMLYSTSDEKTGKMIDNQIEAIVRVKIATQMAEQKIMNDILLPEVQDKSEEEKRAILEEYSKYVVSEKEYFKQIEEKVVGKSKFREQLKVDTVLQDMNNQVNENIISDDKTKKEQEQN